MQMRRESVCWDAVSLGGHRSTAADGTERVRLGGASHQGVRDVAGKAQCQGDPTRFAFAVSDHSEAAFPSSSRASELGKESASNADYFDSAPFRRFQRPRLVSGCIALEKKDDDAGWGGGGLDQALGLSATWWGAIFKWMYCDGDGRALFQVFSWDIPRMAACLTNVFVDCTKARFFDRREKQSEKFILRAPLQRPPGSATFGKAILQEDIHIIAVSRLDAAVYLTGADFIQPPPSSSSLFCPWGKTVSRGNELQREIDSQRDLHLTISDRGQSLTQGVTAPSEEALLLKSRVDEMNARWDNLRLRIVSIRTRLENGADHWHQLMLSLRELVEWVVKKETELGAQPQIGGDVATIMRQQDDHRGFRVQLDDKRPIVESALLAGRNFLQREGADMTPPDQFGERRSSNGGGRGGPGSDRASNGVGPNGTTQGANEDQSRELVRSVRRDVAKLTEKWDLLVAHTDQRHKRLDDVLNVSSHRT
ncbi:dystrophin [Tropilaelaps mercedesae]|uniref:Dystrophin n=1 Tax=Tropilaelaps mercedesae TaxID=418985 RepID=A0A1V9X2Q4_9ACAR|nr:dystrophin [Tropilaelaps mercedesae]